MSVRRPEFQWHAGPAGRPNARVDARRDPVGPGPEWSDDPRAEAFILTSPVGEVVGRAVFGLDRQVVDAPPSVAGLGFAARAWLVARGRRVIAIENAAGETLEEAEISPAFFDEPARGESLVSLCPSNAEMIHAIGAIGRVVACESSSDHPPEVATLERLGPDLAPDLDRVAELAPGLVVSSLSVPGMERNVTGLRCRGVPQVVLAPRNLADVRDELQRLGAALGVETDARAAVARFDAELSALRASSPSAPVRVYLEWWPRPMFTPGADCYSNELIALAGGTNVFGDRPGSSLEIQVEELLAADPDICFVSWCGAPVEKLDPQRLIARPGLESLSAAREKNVFPLDERFSGRPGPRMLEAARVMRAAIAARVG